MLFPTVQHHSCAIFHCTVPELCYLPLCRVRVVLFPTVQHHSFANSQCTASQFCYFLMCNISVLLFSTVQCHSCPISYCATSKFCYFPPYSVRVVLFPTVQHHSVAVLLFSTVQCHSSVIFLPVVLVLLDRCFSNFSPPFVLWNLSPSLSRLLHTFLLHNSLLQLFFCGKRRLISIPI